MAFHLFSLKENKNKNACGEFPGGLVVRILGFHCRGLGSVPGRGTEILQAIQQGRKKEKSLWLFQNTCFMNVFIC